MTAKQKTLKHLQGIKQVMDHFLNQARLETYKQWLTQELQAFSSANGLTLGGEGVSLGEAAGSSNQSPPEGNFLQCAKDKALSLKAALGVPGVRWLTGVEYHYSDGSKAYEAHGMPKAGDSYVGPLGDSKAVEGSVSTGEGQDSHRCTIEAPGAKESVPEAKAAPEAKTEAPPSLDWPATAKVAITGQVMNARLMAGSLLDDKGRMGRKVSVWKGRRFLRTGSILDCKLDLVQGSDARYLPVD